MSKIDHVTAIMSRTLDRYRNSIPRKAFIEAMEAVVAETIGQSETAPKNPAPGLQIIKQPDITAGELADLISGCCPPYCCEDSAVNCDDQSCRACWLAWLTTGRPPKGRAKEVERNE